ncbi:hypothetical protein OfM1_19210 [Lactovum odontotermitis]
MSEIAESFNAQRLKILDYMKEKGLSQMDLFRIVTNAENTEFKYTKQDVSNILNGKRKYTPSVNWFITIVCKTYGIK